ncbi:uncharacterized protein LOC122814282 [Protopterus annectens]|uniref:uncharacterized protein LOC122814282 n=1 Tax=Protopterus annectens TaxID=7888 RepID=UPI001CFA5108|nr:uncharacterized protein LOC122814282 [Protopterus annectens]
MSRYVLNTNDIVLLNNGLSFVPSQGSKLSDVLIDLRLFACSVTLKLHFSKETKITSDNDVNFSLYKKKSSFVPIMPYHVDYFVKLCEIDFYHYFYNGKKKCAYFNMSSDTMKSLQNFSYDYSLTFRPVDKGGGITLFDTADYNVLMNEMLNADATYFLINQAKLGQIIKTVKEDLYDMLMCYQIPNSLHEFFSIDTPVVPIIKGLPKMHKGIKPPPMRPIVSGAKWITENISIYLENVLRPLVDAIPTILKDTYQLIDYLHSFDFIFIQDKHLLITMDVQSLFTSIPNEDGIEAIREILQYFPTIDGNKTILICQLLELVLSNNVFHNGHLLSEGRLYPHDTTTVLKQVTEGTSGKEIVLLTDGEDSDINSCFTEVENSGSIIHTIPLGPQAAKELEELADMTGGHKFYATDSFESNGLTDAFTGILSSNGNLSQQSIQLESNGLTVKTKEWFNSTVSIDKSVGNDTFFVITWQTSEPDIFVQTPSGRIYMMANFKKDTTLKAARLKILGTAETGDWIYSFYNKHSSSQAFGITVTSRAADHSVPPITVNTHMNAYKNVYSSPMVVYAEVSQGFLPVVNATVIAIIESESGAPVTLELFDNGADPDVAKRDGIYSRYFTSFNESGRYSLRVRVQGKETTKLESRRQNRAAYIPGYVDNGKVYFNPSKPPVEYDDFNVDVGSFSRTSSGGSFSVVGVPSGPLRDTFPPSKITDLEAKINEKTFILTWIAPGNDYDLGNGKTINLSLDIIRVFYLVACIPVSDINYLYLSKGHRRMKHFVKWYQLYLSLK